MPENAKIDFYDRKRRFNSALSKLDYSNYFFIMEKEEGIDGEDRK